MLGRENFAKSVYVISKKSRKRTKRFIILNNGFLDIKNLSKTYDNMIYIVQNFKRKKYD